MCFGHSTLGGGAKTRLESGIKKFTPPCVCRPLFVAVTSPVGNLNLRKDLRAGLWLMSDFPKASRASFKFMVGTTTDKTLQAKVEAEMQMFGDVVMLSTDDTFMNLAIKSVGAAAWAQSMPGSERMEYWLKIEDFMSNDFAHVDALVARLQQGQGQQARAKALRMPNSQTALPYVSVDHCGSRGRGRVRAA